MAKQLETEPRERINDLLDVRGPNPLKGLLKQEANGQIPVPAEEGSIYRHFVLETRAGGQQEVYPLGEYTDQELGRMAARPTYRFRWKCKRLLEHAEFVAKLNSDSLEYEHQVTILWSDIASLSEHLGITPQVDELIASLHNAYAQSSKRPTPKSTLEALIGVFRLVAAYTILPSKAVDKALDLLEGARVDLNYPMQFEKADG